MNVLRVIETPAGMRIVYRGSRGRTKEKVLPATANRAARDAIRNRET